MGKNKKKEKRARARSVGTPLALSSSDGSSPTAPRRAVPLARRFSAGYDAARPDSSVLDALRNARPETTLQAQTPEARASIRDQSRCEYFNNPHAGGAARLFGLYVVGTGPRLRFKGRALALGGGDVGDAVRKFVDYRWEQFADEIRFATTLRTAVQCLAIDGEAFLFVGENPKRRLGFDVKLLDSQRIGNPAGRPSTASLQDGVYLDAWGNVEGYCVYDVPETATYYRKTEYKIVGEAQIFHLFREDVPGQTRGVGWFAGGLPLLQLLREYTKAYVETARAGAKIVSTIETQSGLELGDFDEIYASGPAEEGDSRIPYEPFSRVRNAGGGESLVMPFGASMKNFSPSQPTTAADAFTANVLGQIGYGVGLPRNKATGSSHEYNFASGRLDNQPFEMLISALQRDILERRACDRLFRYFYRAIEPELLTRFDSARVPAADEIDWEWVWPQPPLVDPESTARTNAIRLQSGQTTAREIYDQTHPFGAFDDFLRELKRERRELPEIFGLKEPLEPSDPRGETGRAPGENTAINEPKGS